MTQSNELKVTVEDAKKAQDFLKQKLPMSPLVLNPWLSEELECSVYLKLENMMPMGSFKIRGASYKISQLSDQEKKRGVIASSAGNHAQGVAWASRTFGTSALIVMPERAPYLKIQNTQALGAKVELYGENYQAAYEKALQLANETGRVFIHPYDDEKIIAGQATVGLEILEQLPDPDYVIGPIGGGGLMCGVAMVLKSKKPDIKIIGCQASGANPFVQSYLAKEIISVSQVKTFADGIAVSKVTSRIYNFLAPLLDDALDVLDQEIASALIALLEKAKVVSEGAGGVSLAVLRKIKKQVKGKKVVLLVSGGNIDVTMLSRSIDRALLRAGKRLRINVFISDHPGSLAHLTKLVADHGGNIVQVIHDRNHPTVLLDQTEVLLTVETRGFDHSQKLITVLKENFEHLEVLQ